MDTEIIERYYPYLSIGPAWFLLLSVSLGLAALRELQRFRRAPQTALPLLQSFKGFPWQALTLLKALRLHQACGRGRVGMEDVCRSFFATVRNIFFGRRMVVLGLLNRGSLDVGGHLIEKYQLETSVGF